MKNSKILSGKEVFVGIDVHARSLKVALVVDGERVCVFSCEADYEAFINKLKALTSEAAVVYSVYEAGFSGYVLHRLLVAHGIQNIIVNPSSLEVAANDRVKTDKKDAVKLALHLYQGRLKGIFIPSKAQEYDRLLHRTREQFVKDRTAIKNRIRMKLRQFYLMSCNDTQPLTLSKVTQCLEKANNEIVAIISLLVEQWEQINSRITELEKRMEEKAKESSEDCVLQTLPGVGRITARVLVSEIADFHRFKNEKQLASYAGMTPCEFSSGEKIRRGRISRQGSSRLRRVLVEAAWSAIRKDQSLKAYYSRIQVRSGAKRAIVAVARKLLLYARRLIITGEVYSPQQEQATA